MSRASLTAGSGPAAGPGIPPAPATPAFLVPLRDATGLAEVLLRRQEARASSASLLAVPDRRVHLSVWEVGARRRSNAGCVRGCERQVRIMRVPGVAVSAVLLCPHTKLFFG